MKGIVIRDMVNQDYLAVDLRHVLDLLGERAINSQWQALEIWATEKGDTGAARELEELAESHIPIAGNRLHRIANNLVQVIDGEFRAFEHGESSPWVIIRAIDSSYYEVFSPQKKVLSTVRGAFSDVSDCESDF